MTVHFSVDDVSNSLRDITGTGDPFGDRMFRQLVLRHDLYGLKCTLYVYLDALLPLPALKFWRDHAVWLKLGYHSATDQPFSEESGYQSNFQAAKRIFRKIKCGTTDTIRLHYWECTDEQGSFLKRNGVETLLVKADTQSIQSINAVLTDICFENIDTADRERLFTGKAQTVAFTHEWCFAENVQKIETALGLWKNSGYEFIA
jgi:hypothetical protein